MQQAGDLVLARLACLTRRHLREPLGRGRRVGDGWAFGALPILGVQGFTGVSVGFPCTSGSRQEEDELSVGMSAAVA